MYIKKKVFFFFWNIVLECRNYEIFLKICKKYLVWWFERSVKILVCLFLIYLKKLWIFGFDLLIGDKIFVDIMILV